MLSVRDMAGVAAGKLAFKLARKRGGTGSVMPGHWAQKISPHLLETLAQDVEVYLVTGTNGKGSTIAFLSVADNLGQERCICTVLHSNMLNGMVTSFVMESGAVEKSPKKIAFLECDENSLPIVLRKVKPAGILVNNLFLDQADRYRGVEQLMGLLRTSIQMAPNAVLFLNADDPRVVSLADGLPNERRWFGSDVALSGCSEYDGTSCPRCGTALEYSLHTLGHLGHWRCPACGFARPEPESRIATFRYASYLECDVSSPTGSRTYRVAYGQSALLHNVLAAHVLWRAVGGDPDELAMGVVAHSLKEARRHTTVVRGCAVHREMVKNAIGANVAIDRFVDSDIQVTLLLGLGRKVVDSSDSSWIWNVEFERLAACAQRISRIYVLGTASNALIARLVCAGMPRGKIVPLERPDDMQAVCERERELYSFCSGSVTSAVARVVARMREEER